MRVGHALIDPVTITVLLGTLERRTVIGAVLRRLELDDAILELLANHVLREGHAAEGHVVLAVGGVPCLGIGRHGLRSILDKRTIGARRARAMGNELEAELAGLKRPAAERLVRTQLNRHLLGVVLVREHQTRGLRVGVGIGHALVFKLLLLEHQLTVAIVRDGDREPVVQRIVIHAGKAAATRSDVGIHLADEVHVGARLIEGEGGVVTEAERVLLARGRRDRNRGLARIGCRGPLRLGDLEGEGVTTLELAAIHDLLARKAKTGFRLERDRLRLVGVGEGRQGRVVPVAIGNVGSVVVIRDAGGQGTHAVVGNGNRHLGSVLVERQAVAISAGLLHLVLEGLRPIVAEVGLGEGDVVERTDGGVGITAVGLKRLRHRIGLSTARHGGIRRNALEFKRERIVILPVATRQRLLNVDGDGSIGCIVLVREVHRARSRASLIRLGHVLEDGIARCQIALAIICYIHMHLVGIRRHRHTVAAAGGLTYLVGIRTGLGEGNVTEMTGLFGCTLADKAELTHRGGADGGATTRYRDGRDVLIVSIHGAHAGDLEREVVIIVPRTTGQLLGDGELLSGEDTRCAVGVREREVVGVRALDIRHRKPAIAVVLNGDGHGARRRVIGDAVVLVVGRTLRHRLAHLEHIDTRRLEGDVAEGIRLGVRNRAGGRVAAVNRQSGGVVRQLDHCRGAHAGNVNRALLIVKRKRKAEGHAIPAAVLQRLGHRERLDSSCGLIGVGKRSDVRQGGVACRGARVGVGRSCHEVTLCRVILNRHGHRSGMAVIRHTVRGALELIARQRSIADGVRGFRDGEGVFAFGLELDFVKCTGAGLVRGRLTNGGGDVIRHDHIAGLALGQRDGEAEALIVGPIAPRIDAIAPCRAGQGLLDLQLQRIGIGRVGVGEGRLLAIGPRRGCHQRALLVVPHLDRKVLRGVVMTHIRTAMGILGKNEVVGALLSERDVTERSGAVLVLWHVLASSGDGHLGCLTTARKLDRTTRDGSGRRLVDLIRIGGQREAEGVALNPLATNQRLGNGEVAHRRILGVIYVVERQRGNSAAIKRDNRFAEGKTALIVMGNRDRHQTRSGVVRHAMVDVILGIVVRLFLNNERVRSSLLKRYVLEGLRVRSVDAVSLGNGDAHRLVAGGCLDARQNNVARLDSIFGRIVKRRECEGEAVVIVPLATELLCNLETVSPRRCVGVVELDARIVGSSLAINGDDVGRERCLIVLAHLDHDGVRRARIVAHTACVALVLSNGERVGAGAIVRDGAEVERVACALARSVTGRRDGVGVRVAIAVLKRVAHARQLTKTLWHLHVSAIASDHGNVEGERIALRSEAAAAQVLGSRNGERGLTGVKRVVEVKRSNRSVGSVGSNHRRRAYRQLAGLLVLRHLDLDGVLGVVELDTRNCGGRILADGVLIGTRLGEGDASRKREGRAVVACVAIGHLDAGIGVVRVDEINVLRGHRCVANGLEHEDEVTLLERVRTRLNRYSLGASEAEVITRGLGSVRVRKGAGLTLDSGIRGRSRKLTVAVIRYGNTHLGLMGVVGDAVELVLRGTVGDNLLDDEVVRRVTRHLVEGELSEVEVALSGCFNG